MVVCLDTARLSRTETALAALEAWQARHSGPAGEPELDLHGFEVGLRERLDAVGRAILAERLGSLDVDVPAVEVDGVAHRRSLRQEAQYHSSFGVFALERTLYRPADRSGPSVAAVDVQAGLVATRWTPLAAQQVSFLHAHCTAQETADAIALFRPGGESKSTVDRLAKELGEDWEAERVALMAEVRGQEAPPAAAVTVSVSLDGVMGLTRGCSRAEAQAEARKRGKGGGPAGFREFSCGTLTYYDADGERLGTRYIGRMPEARKATLREELTAELSVALSVRPNLTVCKLSDGATDHWRFLQDELEPEGIHVLDFFHAAENLAHALRSAYGEGTPKFHERFATLRHRLQHDDDGVERVIRSLAHLHRRFPRKRLIEKHLKYFRSHRHKMRYAELARRGLPIGSGVVEAACKTLVTARMKRTGMRWSDKGGQAVLTFRALAKSHRFHHAWRIYVARRVRSVEPLETSVVAA